MRYLLGIEKEPSRTLWVVRFGGICGLPGRNGRPHQVRFAAAGDDARTPERAMASTKRFHLESVQFQTGLDFFENRVIKSHTLIFQECHCTTIPYGGASKGLA